MFLSAALVFLDSSLQTHVLSHWVWEKEALTLEQAIRMLSFVHDDANIMKPPTTDPASAAKAEKYCEFIVASSSATGQVLRRHRYIAPIN